jgi:DNA polymerase-3 subunit beta
MSGKWIDLLKIETIDTLVFFKVSSCEKGYLMKFTISRIDLLNLIAKIQAIVPAKPALPVLTNVLVEAHDDQLVLSATDLTVSMRAFASAQVAEEGAITLPAKKFFQLIRELTSSQVEIHAQTPETAHINSGPSHFKMSGMHKNEFPALPDMRDGVSVELDNLLLKEMLIRSSFAAARDDNRQVLNGVLLQHKEKIATFIGTDGKRLARLYAEVNLPESQIGSYIVPLKAVEEMIKLIDVKDDKSKLTFLADKIALEVGSVVLITKLLNGQYPDVDRVIPKKASAPISLHREELMSLLRQVSLFTADTSSAVRFTFAPGQLHLTAMSGDIGEGKVCMSVSYGGPKLDVAFNPHYFLDILRNCRDETVNLSLSDAFNPGLITDSTTAHFVLMPMRLDA